MGGWGASCLVLWGLCGTAIWEVKVEPAADTRPGTLVPWADHPLTCCLLLFPGVFGYCLTIFPFFPFSHLFDFPEAVMAPQMQDCRPAGPGGMYFEFLRFLIRII